VTYFSSNTLNEVKFAINGFTNPYTTKKFGPLKFDIMDKSDRLVQERTPGTE